MVVPSLHVDGATSIFKFLCVCLLLVVHFVYLFLLNVGLSIVHLF